MSKSGRNETPVGQGVDSATMKGIKAQGKYNIVVHEINENAWAAFYASPQGKARLKRMKELSRLKRKRYEAIAAGGGLVGKDRDTTKQWKNTKFDREGNVIDSAEINRRRAEDARLRAEAAEALRQQRASMAVDQPPSSNT